VLKHETWAERSSASCRLFRLDSSWKKKKFERFCIDVTFEMRTAYNSESFIQLIIFSFGADHFISKVETGEES
jgi:hypothetical protein